MRVIQSEDLIWRDGGSGSREQGGRIHWGKGRRRRSRAKLRSQSRRRFETRDRSSLSSGIRLYDQGPWRFADPNVLFFFNHCM